MSAPSPKFVCLGIVRTGYPRKLFMKFDWIGSAMGLAGALLLSTNTIYSPFGWVLFLGSNAAWIVFSVQRNLAPLLVMQLGFTGTSILGIVRWFG